MCEESPIRRLLLFNLIIIVDNYVYERRVLLCSRLNQKVLNQSLKSANLFAAGLALGTVGLQNSN